MIPIKFAGLCLLLPLLPAVAQAQFGYTVNNNTATITSYSGASRTVAIPSSISGLTVVGIGSMAFYQNSSITNVSIPGTVTNIGDFAFNGCSALATVSLASGLVNVGNYAFGQSGLLAIAIPNSVQNLGDYAFNFCSALTNVVIGNSVTNIGYATFTDCGAVRSLVIPASVTTIGNSAFADWYSLSNNLAIPATVASVGDSAFQYCYRLTAITLGGSSGAPTVYGNYVFANCYGLTNATLANSVTNIGAYQFAYCSNLAGISLGSGLSAIGQYAFVDCNRLLAFSVNPANPFFSGLGGVLFNAAQTTLVQYPGGLAGTYTIPASVTAIGATAFAYQSGLTSLTISSNVTTLGSGAFDYCSSLAAITVDLNNPAFSSLNGVLFNKNQTALIQYPVAKTGSSYSVPAGVTNIGVAAFAEADNLYLLYVPASLNGIGESAFADCSALNGIYFQGNAPATGSYSFYGSKVTAYYLAGATGWTTSYNGIPTATWVTQILFRDGNFKFYGNQIGFNILSSTNLALTVQGCANLTNPAWSTVTNISLTPGFNFVTDPQSVNARARFYRLR